MLYDEKLLKQDISIAASGDNIVITPGAGEMPATWENKAVTILIDHINLLPAGATTLQFKSGKVSGEGTQTNYGGLYTLAQGQAMTLENGMQNSDDGVIRLAPNQSLIINLGSAVQVSGFIRYRLKATN